ncbi:YtxH domain-containing protein [Fictibacillus enclensis]|uniref:YtxH domain-containing protein n=1 Tax=Fictibacillus enclensis TaxID=1017270 RepID=UPI0025A1A738|nr:YtxH domain-containing protein [Fictibacillus enclensis]MDM5337680.1 YtxH domain-containing protein [Fictibacillus enclensis]
MPRNKREAYGPFSCQAKGLSLFQAGYRKTMKRRSSTMNKEYTTTTNNSKEKSGFTTGVLVGGLVGAATALLLTPKSGKEMRAGISSQTSNLKEKTMQMKDEAKLQTQLGTMAGKEKASNMMDSVKDKANQVTSQAKEKVSSMKNKKNANTPTVESEPGLPPSPEASKPTLGE